MTSRASTRHTESDVVDIDEKCSNHLRRSDSFDGRPRTLERINHHRSVENGGNQDG